MKKSISKTAAWLAATIASISTAHADALRLEITQPTLQQIEMLRDLLTHRVIQRLDVASWFQIDRKALEAELEMEANGDAEAHRLVGSLRGLCGEGTDIRQVDILMFQHGTQDV